MSNSAEDLDFLDPTEGQLDQLEQGSGSTASVIKINDLRSAIADKIKFAKNEGSISEKDADELRKDLERTDTDIQAVYKVGHTVEKVIGESKKLLLEFANNDEVGEEELGVFKELSLDEKRVHVEMLQKKLGSLQRRVSKLSEFLPEEQARLKMLKGNERAKYVEELNERRENVAGYAAMFEKYREYFSAKSAEEYMRDFKEQNLPKQAEWLKVFEATQAKPRMELAKRFGALPAKYRESTKNFNDFPRHEKEALVLKLEEERDFDADVDFSADSRHMSTKSREFAKEVFKKAGPTLRKDMKVMLKKHMKAEADLSRKFELLPAGVRSQHPEFFELDFEKKEQVLQVLDKEGVQLKAKYEQFLRSELMHKNIGHETYASFMRWFEERDLMGKKLAVNLEVYESEMLPRRAMRARFEKEIPKELRDANSHFYELSRHDRMELFERLKRQINGDKPKDAGAAKDAAKEGAGAEHLQKMLLKAQEMELSGSRENAMLICKSILLMNPEHALAKKYLAALKARKPEDLTKAKLADVAEDSGADIADSDTNDAIRATKETSVMRKKIKHLNIAEGLSDLAKKSDLYNRGVTDSQRKDQHLKSEREKQIADKLVQHSEGKVVAAAGDEKSKTLKKVDVTTFGEMNEEQQLDLKNQVVSHEGEKGNNVYHLQMIDKKEGRSITGAVSKQRAVEMRKTVEIETAKNAAAAIEQARGKALSRAAKEKLQQAAKKEGFKVNLREAV